MNTLSNIHKKTLKVLSFFTEYFQDLVKFLSFNHYSPRVPLKNRLYYRIIISAHAIEKGLSLRKPRPLFGRDKISELCNLINLYDRGGDPFPIAMALGALEEYVLYNTRIGCAGEYLDDLKTYSQNKLREWKLDPTGGTKPIKKSRLDLARHSSEHCDFLTSRFSCRSFSDDRLDDTLVQQIVKVASSAPSQCNRQSARLHCYRNRKKIFQLLDLQAGSRGFSKNVPNLFIVTYELPGWGGRINAIKDMSTALSSPCHFFMLVMQ